MDNEEYSLLPTLYNLTILKISTLILRAWNLESQEINEIKRVNKECCSYFELPSEVCFNITCAMILQNKTLSFGQSMWLLESRCDRLYKRWLSGINLENLCEIASDKAKDVRNHRSILEFYVTSDEDEVSDIQFAKHFSNLTRLKICDNEQVNNWQVAQIISNCHLLQDVSLKGCINISDTLLASLWKNPFVQDNLRVIDISQTSVSGCMAATIYFLLPQLILLLYDDISSFLRYRCNINTNKNTICSRLVHTVRLGNAGDHRLRFVSDEVEPYKVMELALPNYDVPSLDQEGCRNVFRFEEDEYEAFRFQDVYLAMCSVASHLTFGVAPERSYLRELALTNVRNIDLNSLFSHFPRLKSVCLWRDCSVTDSVGKFYLGKAVLDIEFWFISSEVVNVTLRHCPNVEYLTVRFVKLADDTFRNVTFNSLKLVELSRCEGSHYVENVFPVRTRVDIY
uniref:F-box domain-containing protein n=1 Tax=Strigamia maritima TaxID=126957 RepID=T1IJ91_STRMM